MGTPCTLLSPGAWCCAASWARVASELGLRALRGGPAGSRVHHPRSLGMRDRWPVYQVPSWTQRGGHLPACPALWKLVFPACVTDGPRPTAVKDLNLERTVLALRNSMETRCCSLITAGMTSNRGRGLQLPPGRGFTVICSLISHGLKRQHRGGLRSRKAFCLRVSTAD